MSSPGRYGLEPATSVPEPLRRLLIVPNERPMTRRRGTSGNVSRAPGTGATPRAGSGSELEAAPPEVLDRLRQSRRAGSGDEGRCEHDTVDEDRSKQTLDVLRNHVAAPVQERPGAGRPLQRKTPANRAADHDALLLR